jgi:HK97 family phage portal protein
MPNIFSNIMSRIAGGMWTRYGGQGWTRYRFLMPGSRFDYERDAGDLWMNPVVGLCLDWLGNRFPRPLLHVSKVNQRTREYTPLGRHPLTDLWDRPNQFYSRRTMEKAVGLSLKVDGNAYIYKARDRAGRVAELWWVPHFRVMPTWPADGSAYVDGYRIRLDSAVYTLPVEDIIHIRDGIDPRNERLGLCALRSNIREVCTINEESGYRAAILRNSGVPGLVVIPDSDQLRPSQADADTIREKLHETVGGDNRGQTVVLGGRYKVEMLGFSPEQLNLVEFPVIPTARILSSMGVAPMSVGLPDPGKTYANLGEANRSSWGSIVSTQELVAEALRWNLLPEFGADPYAYTCEYDYTHIQELQESLDAVHTRTREDFKSGLITQNEGREQIGFDPDPDGDRYYPGTGSPAEIEQQQEQQQAMLEHAATLKQPAENTNGKVPQELAKRWSY